MPDPTPPGDAGGAAGRPPGPLRDPASLGTPAAIDAVLADFRRWLEDLAATPDEPSLPPVTHGGLSDVDLATVVAAFTALRHEVNLQTKATRAQSEQLAQALDALRQPPPAANGDDAARPLVQAVAEAYDALTRTTAELDRLREGIVPPAAPSLWQRLSGRRPDTTTADRLAAAVTGLRMSEARVERLMREVGLEAVESVGRPFDPEAMEAVEAVADAGRPPGMVVEEVRRGYRWRGRVVRYAQVRVAK